MARIIRIILYCLYIRLNIFRRIVHRLIIRKLSIITKRLFNVVKKVFIVYFIYFIILILFITRRKMKQFLEKDLKRKRRAYRRLFWRKILVMVYFTFIIVLFLLKKFYRTH